MRVLSLFDGISCARVALERSGITVEAYYASEIDSHAIEIAKKNWPGTVHLGDVRNLKASDIAGGIDLLVGGSPCQDLSRANTTGKGLEGKSSSLFYEYLRILKETRPRYFILENVASMKNVYRDEITKELGVEPIMIDAGLVSAQQRKRYFWTNIPGVCQPHDRGILLKDVLEHGFPLREGEKARTLTVSYGKNHPSASRIGTKYEKTMVAKHPLILGKENGGIKIREATKKGYAVAHPGDSIDLSFPSSTTRRGRVGKKVKTLTTSTPIHVLTKDEVRILTPVECERLTTLPDGYTEGVSETQRRMLCGNAFVVEVVAHVLKHIPKT